MLYIKKGAEPDEYKDFKRDNSKISDLTDYEGKYNDLITTEAKKAIQESLCKEQGYLCCYCMQRIGDIRCPDDKSHDVKCMRLEHFKCQSGHKELKFEYSNMLAACHGFNRMDSSEEHCDVKKRSLGLKYNPAQHNVEQYVAYTPDGTIFSADPEFDKQLNDILNLNIGYLKNNRKSKRLGVVRKLNTSGEWKKSKLQEKILSFVTPNAKGELKEYSGVVTNYLRKKLK